MQSMKYVMAGLDKRILTWITAAYIVIMPTTVGKALREALWVAGAIVASVVVANIVRRRHPMPPSPGRWIVISFGFWMLWCALSFFWSDRPAFTADELRKELLNNLLLMGIVYIVADGERAMRVLSGAILASFAIHATIMAGWAPFTGDLDPFRWHQGVVWVGTWLALAAPFLLLPLLPDPPGFDGGKRGTLVAAFLFSLLFAVAVMSENRMIWIALAVQAITVAVLMPRDRNVRSSRLPVIEKVVLASVVGVLGIGFAWALFERTPHATGSASVLSNLQQDPRLDLWKKAMTVILERPWLGHGFGKGIGGEAIARELDNPLLWHPHNVFLSQWQQTGAIGVAALATVLVAVAAKFFRFARDRDRALAVTGVLGLALLLGFLAKNLTDDFLVRNAAKQFWVYTALLLGYGARRAAAQAGALPRPAPG